MKYNERLDKFLQLQSKNLKFDEIAKEIGIAPSTLRKFLNKAGYKSVNNKYILDLNNIFTMLQISFGCLSFNFDYIYKTS